MNKDLLDYALLEMWFTRQNLSESTQDSYTRFMKAYCQFNRKTLENLLDEAEQEEDQGIRLRKRKISKNILKFKQHLESQEKSPNTVRAYINAIKSFYEVFDITTPKISWPNGDICLEKNYSKLITKQEIQKMIEVANSRDRAMIYVMALSGMSQAEVRNLTIKTILKSASETLDKPINSVEKLLEYKKELQNEILTLHILRKKVNYRYITFLPPESVNALLTYLNERIYGPNDKIRIEDHDNPIFVLKNGKPMTKVAVTSTFGKIGKRAGFKVEKGAFKFFRSHGLRKYFISTIINSIGDHILADYLAGHKIDDVKRAYWRADPEKLKEKYLDALPYLSIDEIKVKTYYSKEYEKVIEDSKNKGKMIAKMQLEQAEMEERMKRYENVLEVAMVKLNKINK